MFKGTVFPPLNILDEAEEDVTLGPVEEGIPISEKGSNPLFCYGLGGSNGLAEPILNGSLC